VKALAAAGDAAAARERFAELISTQQARANRIAFAYLRNAADADEVVQDAFVRVYTHIGEYREELGLEQWFTRILVNRCVDAVRARRRREARVSPLLLERDLIPARTEPPDRRLHGIRWREAVTRALRYLPDRQRVVFAMCHYEGRSSSEIAALLGMREATVRVHLFRAVRKLRASLEAWRDTR